MTIEANDIDQKKLYLTQSYARMFDGKSILVIACNMCIVKIQDLIPYPIMPMVVNVVGHTKCPVCKIPIPRNYFTMSSRGIVYKINVSRKAANEGGHLFTATLCLPCLLEERETNRDRQYIILKKAPKDTQCTKHN